MDSLTAIFNRLKTPGKSKYLTVLALVVGAVAGVAAFIFVRLTELVHLYVNHLAQWHTSLLSRVVLILAPAAGGWVAGWLIQKYALAYRGTGTAQVIYSIRRRTGHIPTIVTIAKTLASALTIGTGGSAGPEGPAVQIGAGIGSTIGRWRRLPPDYLRTLVAAGAAAGIAAVFNAPIAGVMYALEVLLRQIASQSFVVVVLSTVTASIVSYALIGHRIFLKAPAFYTGHPAEWIAYLVLGVLAAFAARFFTAIYLSVEKRFSELSNWSIAARAMLGGLLVGILGFAWPDILGSGRGIVLTTLQAGPSVQFGVFLCLLLLIGKMLATSFSLGSGGSGGLFVPTLSMGALLGALVGKGVHLALPQAAPIWAYALLGMGAMFAGFTYAPFTSVLLLFEMTNDYPIVLPLMAIVGVTMIVSRTLDRNSLDAHELGRKGLRLHEDVELAALEHVTAQEVMASPVESIPEGMLLKDVAQWMAQKSHSGAPVNNESGEIVGFITLNELHEAYSETDELSEICVAKDVMRMDFPIMHPAESLTEAVRRMQKENIDRILVVDPAQTDRALGIITKSDVLKIYHRLLK
jgi:CIC family chloride channel protein